MRVLILILCLVCASLIGATTAMAAIDIGNHQNVVVCVISDVPASPPPEVAMTVTVNGEDVSDVVHESAATARSRVRGIGKTVIKAAVVPVRIAKKAVSRVVTRVQGREHKIVVRIFHRLRGCRR